MDADVRGVLLGFLSNTPALTSLVALLIIVIIGCVYSRMRVDPKLVKFGATLPGPPALPFIGNGLDLFFAKMETLDWIMDCGKKYGPIFRIWFGKQLVVFLSDLNDLEYVFRNPKVNAKPALFATFREFLGEGLFTSSTHIWKKTRKLHQSVYTSKVLSSYVPQFNEKIQGLVETLQQFVDGPEFDMIDHLPYITFDIVAKTALGVDIDGRDEMHSRFYNCIRTALETSIERMLKPWLHIKSISYLVLGKRIGNARNEMLKVVEQFVENRFRKLRQTGGEIKDTESVTETPFMLAAYRSYLATGYKNLLRDEVATVLAAGTDTVATTTAFCILAIAANPDIQDKLYDEMFEVFGDGDRLADENDLTHLPYLNQVVKETMRRYPLGPLLFRNVEEDSQIGTRIFPAGTAVIICTQLVHMNPQYYPNPEKFDPENFAPDAVEKRPKLAFLNFGAGGRMCIGMNYGILEVKLMLIALLRAFQFRTTLRLDELKVVLGFNNHSADGYRMSITQRDRRPTYLRQEKVV